MQRHVSINNSMLLLKQAHTISTEKKDGGRQTISKYKTVEARLVMLSCGRSISL
jgi:hypothetical protein